MDDERLAKLDNWMGRDPDIRRVIIACISEVDCRDTRQLYDEHPTVFDDLYEAIEWMVDDIPIHNPPGFSR